MASPKLQEVFDQARVYLHDTQIAGGEIWQNAQLQIHFNEPYRRMFNCLMGVSKRVQRIVYANFGPNQTVLIPQNYGITDFAEPAMIEERPANTPIAIQVSSNTTPIIIQANGHGLGAPGSIVEGVIGGVIGTTAPWGNWFVTVIDNNQFSLNGSATDGAAGAGGSFTTASQQQYVEVLPVDLAFQGLDGIPQQYLGNYLWINEQIQFRGSVGTQQLRITYWASGSPPTSANTTINIDNCIDFLACATAANAARANSWFQLADQLKFTAYGQAQEAAGNGGLLGEFVKIQVLTLQRGPQRRRLPFRDKRSRYGSAIIAP